MFDELSHYLPRHIEAPDLPGHGASSNLPATFESVVGLVEWLAGGEPPVLIGYSMGGRLALRYALERPVAGLVLVSAGPGIAHPVAREERRISDERLAADLAVVGVEAFIDQWLGNPMFGGLAKRHEIWRAVDRETTGTTRKRISRSKLGQIMVPVAPKADQARSVKKLDELIAEITCLEQVYERKVAALHELEKSVLHQAFNGHL